MMSNKLVTAYDMIKARDAAIDELQNEVNRLAPYEMFYERTLKRAEAAERRIAELEARLAEQEWRPVTTEWPPYRIPMLGRASVGSPLILLQRYPPEIFAPPAEWVDDQGVFYETGEITECRLITTPPPTATE